MDSSNHKRNVIEMIWVDAFVFDTDCKEAGTKGKYIGYYYGKKKNSVLRKPNCAKKLARKLPWAIDKR